MAILEAVIGAGLMVSFSGLVLVLSLEQDRLRKLYRETHAVPRRHLRVA